MFTQAKDRVALFLQSLDKSIRVSEHFGKRRSNDRLLSFRLENLEERRLLSGSGGFDDASVVPPRAVISQSVFDPAMFAHNIREALTLNAVGYGYSINSNGTINRYSGGGGSAITAASNGGAEVQFTAASEMTVASVSKTITAVGMLHLLKAEGISIDDPISPYLPRVWQQGVGIAPSDSYVGVTFRELLTHQSGLRRIDFDGSAAGRDGPNHDKASLSEQTRERGLRQLIRNGIGQFDFNGDGVIKSGEQLESLKENYSYENANFALMRVMLPFIWSEVPNSVANGDRQISHLPESIEAFVENDWNGTLSMEKIRASIYKLYIERHVFGAMGINGVETEGFGPNQTRNYPFPAGNDPGFEMNDRTLQAGGEGWFLDARELGIFLHHITHENSVLSNQTRNMMRDNFLGFNDPDNISHGTTGIFGTYYNHGGDLKNLKTAIAIFPNDVEASLLINSETAPNVLEKKALLSRAYDNAWSTVTIKGTPLSDHFTIEEGNRPQSIKVSVNNSALSRRRVIGTFEAAKLDTLIAKGLGGNDTFTVNSLPFGIELDLRGNSGDDHFAIGDDNLETNIRGVVRPKGGLGSDTVSLFDENDLSGNDQYSLLWNSVTKTNMPSSISHNGVETLNIHAGPRDNTIVLTQPIPGTNVSVYAGDGNDTVILTGGTLQTNVVLDGQQGRDEITVQNLNLASSSAVTVRGGNGRDRLTASNVSGAAGTSLELNGDGSNDILVLDRATGRMKVSMSGEGENDSLRVLNSNLNSNVYLLGGEDNDFFRLGGGDISDNLAGNFVVDGQAGEDHLVLEDRNGDGANDSYVFNVGLFSRSNRLQNFTKNGFGGLIWHDETENVTLKGTRQDSSTHVRELYDLTTLNANVVDGDDNVFLHASQAKSTINVKAGEGRNRIEVAPDSQNLSRVRGYVNVDGQNGADRFILNDQNSTHANDYILDDNTFERTRSREWIFDQVEAILLHANDSPNELAIEGLLATVNLTANLNGGKDMALLTPNSKDLDSSIRGELTIRGGDGDLDSVFFFDDNDNGDDTYEFLHGAFEKSTTNRWYLQQFERQTLEANHDSNTINVPRFGSLTSDSRLTVFGGAGNDEMIVGSGLLRSSFVYDLIRFFGEQGDDRLIIEDRASNSDRTYDLTRGEVVLGTLGGRVRHTDVNRIAIRGGERNDTFNVEENRSSVDLTLSGNAGSDVFQMAQPTKNLNDVRGNIRLSGGASPIGQPNFDTVTIHDKQYAGNGDYAVQPSPSTATISRVADGFITIGSIERTKLLAGSGNNTIDIGGYVAGSELVLDAGQGSDIINVHPTASVPLVPLGLLRLKGGGGAANALNVIDDIRQNVSPYAIRSKFVRQEDDSVMPIRYTQMDSLSLSVHRGDNAVNVYSTSTATPVSISTGSGDDYVRVSASTPNAFVNAGSNGVDGDVVAIRGSNDRDQFVVRGESVSFGDGQVETRNVELREINGRSGDDVVTVRGVRNVDESFLLRPDANSPNGAVINSRVFSVVNTANVSRFRVFGNNADRDSFVFAGRGANARYDVNLGATGSATSSFLSFSNNAGSELTVQNSMNMHSTNLRGTSSDDTFNIRAANSGLTVGRQMTIDGGSSNRNVSEDRILFRYPENSGTFDHDIVDADSGTLSIEFPQRTHEVDYDDVEEVRLLPF